MKKPKTVAPKRGIGCWYNFFSDVETPAGKSLEARGYSLGRWSWDFGTLLEYRKGNTCLYSILEFPTTVFTALEVKEYLISIRRDPTPF